MSSKLKIIEDPFDLIRARFQDVRPLGQISVDEFQEMLDGIFPKIPDKKVGHE
jgi:hypothetical protein